MTWLVSVSFLTIWYCFSRVSKLKCSCKNIQLKINFKNYLINLKLIRQCWRNSPHQNLPSMKHCRHLRGKSGILHHNSRRKTIQQHWRQLWHRLCKNRQNSNKIKTHQFIFSLLRHSRQLLLLESRTKDMSWKTGLTIDIFWKKILKHWTSMASFNVHHHLKDPTIVHNYPIKTIKSTRVKKCFV